MDGMDSIPENPAAPSFTTRVIAASPAGVAEAAALLAGGDVVGLPTETVYGLAGDAFNEAALRRIFEAKGRPTDDPLILHLVLPREGVAGEGEGAVGEGAGEGAGGERGAAAWMSALGVIDGTRLGEAARGVVDHLARTFWPGPLTLVLPRGARVPLLATSGLDTVAVRAPAHPVAQAVLEAVGVPLAAPSANRFGRISPTTAQHVLEELGGRIPLILDGGAAEVGVESTVVRVTADGDITCLRPGGIPMEALLEGLDRGSAAAPSAAAPSAEPPSAAAGAMTPSHAGPHPSPGMLESHYAPSCHVMLLPAPVREMPPESLRAHLIERGAPLLSSVAVESGTGVGLLLQGGVGWEEALATVQGVLMSLPAPVALVAHGVLAPDGQAKAAARALFGVLRALDHDPRVAWILAEPPSNEVGLRAAIKDRLRRAAAPRSPTGSRLE
jgi:L-threonylcarbamoyladenylate synthase